MRATASPSRTYVADIEVITGGTGFSILKMFDPVVQSAGNGFTLEARVGSLLGKEYLSLFMAFEKCRTRFDRQANFFARIPGAGAGQATREAAKGSSPVAVLPYVIDLPDQEAMIKRNMAALPAGRPVILELRKSLGGQGRMAVVTARVEALGEGR